MVEMLSYIYIFYEISKGHVITVLGVGIDMPNIGELIVQVTQIVILNEMNQQRFCFALLRFLFSIL